MQKTLNRSHTAYRRTYFIVTIYIIKRHVMITLAFVLLVAQTKKQKPFKVKLPVFFIHSSHFRFLLTECFSALINRSSVNRCESRAGCLGLVPFVLVSKFMQKLQSETSSHFMQRGGVCAKYKCL